MVAAGDDRVAQLAPAGRTCFYGCLPNTIEDLSEIPVIAADTRNGSHRGNLYVAFYYDAGKLLRVLVSTSRTAGRRGATRFASRRRARAGTSSSPG